MGAAPGATDYHLFTFGDHIFDDSFMIWQAGKKRLNHLLEAFRALKIIASSCQDAIVSGVTSIPTFSDSRVIRIPHFGRL